jgi:hypothetical protein
MTDVIEVTLHSAPGCCLCEEAKVVLTELQASHRFRLVEKDITQDPGLHLRYLERIPVVTIGGEEICEYFVEEERVIAKLYCGTSQPANT